MSKLIFPPRAGLWCLKNEINRLDRCFKKLGILVQQSEGMTEFVENDGPIIR